MTILHIANSYGGTDVYTNLYTAIDANTDVRQWVYVPLNSRNHNRVGNKMIMFRNKESEIHYSTILRFFHRYLYGLKIRAVVQDVERKFDVSQVDVLHAGTLCMDGAIAYELSKKYGKPFVVSVRGTDNSYYRLIWRHSYFTKILKNASEVVYISPMFKDVFMHKKVPYKTRMEISSHVAVIPNGIGNLFLDHRFQESRSLGCELHLLFVGAFYKGKGLVETIKAIELLRRKGLNLTLTAIGKGLPNRPQDSTYISQVESLAADKDWLTTLPFMQPEEIIKKMREANAFIMVSKPETFGLVYVEALSQGLPIIYARNQGFDGYYPAGYVGYPAESENVEDIAEKLERLINNYDMLAKNVASLDLMKDFNWENIAQKYINLYQSFIL